MPASKPASAAFALLALLATMPCAGAEILLLGAPLQSRTQLTAATVDARGDYFLTGSFVRQLVIGDTKLTTPAGEETSDGFTLKVSPNGQVQWAKSFGGPGWDHGRAIAVDTNSCYVTGVALSPFKAGGQTVNTNPGRCVVLLRYDLDGNLAWTRSITSTAAVTRTNTTFGEKIIVSRDGGPVISALFEAGSLETNLVSSRNPGLNRALIAKYSRTGECEWSHTIQCDRYFNPHELVEAPSGELYLVASFKGKATVGRFELDSGKYFCGAIVKIGRTHAVEWVHKFDVDAKMEADCFASTVRLDARGNLFVGGRQTERINHADPRWKVELPPTPMDSFWLAKLDSDGKVLWRTTPGNQGYLPIALDVTSSSPSVVAVRSELLVDGLPKPVSHDRWLLHNFTADGGLAKSAGMNSIAKGLDLTCGIFGPDAKFYAFGIIDQQMVIDGEKVTPTGRQIIIIPQPKFGRDSNILF